MLGIVLYSWTEYRRAPAVGLAVDVRGANRVLFCLGSRPRDMARGAVGIGRGVDLILYLWVVISLIVLLNLHLKLRVQMEVITVLARELAIANARSTATPK